MDSVAFKNVYVKSENLVARRISGETVIVPVRGGVGELDSVYTLNELGTRIWQLLDGRMRPDQITYAIVQEYDVSEQQASLDVADFLATLASAKLIKPAG